MNGDFFTKNCILWRRMINCVWTKQLFVCLKIMHKLTIKAHMVEHLIDILVLLTALEHFVFQD